jgi:ribonucleoside-diphosphate reductase alpha chain
MYTYQEALESSMEYFNGDQLAAEVFLGKYALTDPKGNLLEKTPEDMHRRLAREFARIENKFPNEMSEEEIFELFDRFKYIVPQGSPMAGIGNKFQVQSLSNCFSLEPVVDSYGGILKTDQELVQIAKRRGGVGFDISNLRPKGKITKNAAKTTDGIAVFMERFSNSTREVAQCIAKGERVLTKNGLTNIENVKVGQKTWTKEGWIKVTNKFKNGKKKIFKLTTKAGYSIKTSKEHIFITEEDNNLKEIKLKDFKIGDDVILLCGTENLSIPNSSNLIPCNKYKNINNKPNNCKLPKQINEKLAYVLGYSYGDGSVERNKKEEPRTLSLTCSNDWEQITSQLFSYISDTFEYRPTLRKGDGNLKRLTINNKCVVNFLHENNILKQKTKEIQFPFSILKNSTNIIFAFLSGYFDADGYASGSKKGYVFSSISLSFLKQIQTLLMSFGTPSKIHCEKRKTKGWNDLYSLAIVGSYAKTKFVKLMKKSIKVQSLQDCGKMDFWRTPYKAKTFGIKYNNYNYCPNNSAYLSINVFNRLKQDGENLPEILLKDKVANIKEIGQEETYDLELESENLFWCEGFYVHNSGRRGACLMSISVHHPEIETFITIKNNLKKVTGANLSIRLSDEFMNAVKNKEEVELRWPVDSKNPEISERVNATKIWNKICKSAYNYAEPGVLFWDTIINNTPSDAYATKGFNSVGVNPCSELILSSNDACRLLLINAFSFVKKPFTKNAGFDWKKFVTISNKAQRLMDDMVELEIECLDKILEKIENDPEPEEVKFVEKKMWLNIKEKAIQGRRTGTGLTGIGDVLAALDIQYSSKKSIKIVEKIYKHLAIGCYQATIEMAKERGRFPIYENKLEEKNKYLQKIISSLGPKYQKDYKSYGRRNIALTTTAPAGSVSLLTQTSSGIEPVFKLEYTRRKKITENIPVTQVDFVDNLGDRWQEFMIRHHGYQKWIDINKSKEKFNSKHSPYHGSTSAEIDWVAGVQLQAAAQKWIDHSISRTTNLPSDAILSDVKNIYMQSKCKGLTVYREGSRSGVLVDKQNTTNNRKTLIENHAPKRPEKLPCDIYHITVDYQKWNCFVGLFEGKPFEVFAGLAKYVRIPKRYTKGRIEKHNGGSGAAHYDLFFGDDPDDEMMIQDIDKIFENATGAAFTRVVSLALRHGTPAQYAVEQIVKGSNRESNLFSLNKAVARVLKNYIINGTKPSQKECSECGGTDLAYEEGCITCKSCSASKCS